MTVTNKRAAINLPYYLQGQMLRKVEEYKYLGVIISSDLKWNKQVAYITNKALAALYSIKRSLKSASVDTKLLAYTSLVRSIMGYGIICWLPFRKQYIERLEGVQRKAVRFIFNKYRRHDSPTQLLRQADLPTIHNRARLLRLKFLFLLLNGGMKIDTSKYLIKSNTRTTRTKHQQHLTEYRFHNDIFRYSFFPQAIREWNSLPCDAVNCASLKDFIANISRFILQ